MEEEVRERNKLCWWQNDDDKLELTVAGKEVSEWVSVCMDVLRRKATDLHRPYGYTVVVV